MIAETVPLCTREGCSKPARRVPTIRCWANTEMDHEPIFIQLRDLYTCKDCRIGLSMDDFDSLQLRRLVSDACRMLDKAAPEFRTLSLEWEPPRDLEADDDREGHANRG